MNNKMSKIIERSDNGKIVEPNQLLQLILKDVCRMGYLATVRSVCKLWNKLVDPSEWKIDHPNWVFHDKHPVWVNS
jgi:hypothetical protein